MRSFEEPTPEARALAAARGLRQVSGPAADRTAGAEPRDDQMRLFGIDGAGRRRRPRSRNARMATRLEEMALVAEREEASARRHGDQIEARRARERAQDARRAAAMLRAGPSGVGSVLAS